VGCAQVDFCARTGIRKMLNRSISDEEPLTNENLLVKACLASDIPTVKLLLGKGMDVNIITFDGRGALDFAIMDLNLDIIRLLCARGAFLYEYNKPQNSVYKIDFCVPTLLHCGAHLLRYEDEEKIYSDSDHIPLLQRINGCRKTVRILLALKKRRIKSMHHLDRFLIAQLGVEIWTTRSLEKCSIGNTVTTPRN
jgi:hypothetical protein